MRPARTSPPATALPAPPVERFDRRRAAASRRLRPARRCRRGGRRRRPRRVAVGARRARACAASRRRGTRAPSPRTPCAARPTFAADGCLPASTSRRMTIHASRSWRYAVSHLRPELRPEPRRDRVVAVHLAVDLGDRRHAEPPPPEVREPERAERRDDDRARPRCRGGDDRRPPAAEVKVGDRLGVRDPVGPRHEPRGLRQPGSDAGDRVDRDVVRLGAGRLQLGDGQADAAAVAVPGVPAEGDQLGVAARAPVGPQRGVAAVDLDDPVQQRGADADVDLGVEQLLAG